jgi:hypothetical protein
MNLPQLTAEASLYQPRTQYRTNARTSLFASSGRGMITTAQGEIGTSNITVPGETITVIGTVPKGGGTVTTPSQTGTGTKGGGRGRGHGPSGGHKGNGLNGGDYNPSTGGSCCGKYYLAPGSWVLSQSTYASNSDLGWSCGDVPCDPVKGKSKFCADGGCG